MKRTRGDLVRVGVFTLVVVGLFLGGLLWIAGSRLLRARESYQVIFEQSVTGLSAGSQVEYQGVVIGRVRDIRLTPDIPPKVSVTVDLDPGTPVRRDTQAVLLGSIVTGIQYIQLQGGSEAAGPLPTGGAIPGTVPSLVELRDRLTRVADLALTILTRLEQDMFTEQNVEKVQLLIDDLGTLADRLTRASEALPGEHPGEDLAEMIEAVTRAANAMDAVLGDLRAGRERGSVVEDLAQATRRLQEVLDLIEADPSLLLRGREIPKREFER